MKAYSLSLCHLPSETQMKGITACGGQETRCQTPCSARDLQPPRPQGGSGMGLQAVRGGSCCRRGAKEAWRAPVYPHSSPLPKPWLSQTYFLHSQGKTTIYSPTAYAPFSSSREGHYSHHSLFYASQPCSEERRALYEAWRWGYPRRGPLAFVLGAHFIQYIWMKSREIMGHG